MTIIFVYVALTIIVGVAANSRGRSGIGWFLLALLISPLIAGLLVLALRRIDRDVIASEKRDRLLANSTELLPVPSGPGGPFEPDGVIRGFPYRVGDNGVVEAMMTAGLIRFRNMDQFLAAAEGRDATQPQASSPPLEKVTSSQARTSILRVFRRAGSTDHLRKYKILVNGAEIGTIARNSVADFQVPSGRLTVAARIDWGRSQPLMIEVKPGKRIEIEVSNTRGPLLAIWAITFGAGKYLTLKQLPT